MLEGLDAIDWTVLEHAYGPATDVPGMIRALGSTDERVRERAFHEAYGNIFHQGTRYTATPKAIPFLIELASRPDAPQLGGLLGLITHCVAAYFSPTAGPQTSSGTLWGEVARPMTDYGETKQILADCEHAAEGAVPLCLALIRHPDAEVRAAACKLLAALHAYAARYDVLPRLRWVLGTDNDPWVRATAAFAVSHLMPMPDSVLLEGIAREDRDPLVRVVATLGCVRRGHATSDMPPALLSWLSDTALSERYAKLPFPSDDLPGDIAALLPELGQFVLHAALPTLIEHLAHAQGFGVVGILEAALTATFGRTPPPANAAQLTADQRLVLETIAHSHGFWEIGNAMSVLLERGLPSYRDAMAEYLGIEVTEDLFARGLELNDAGDLDGAAEAFARARETMVGAGAERARHNLIAVLQGLGRYDQALAIVQERPARSREDYYELGLAQVKAGKYPESIASITRVLADEPDHALAHYTIACAYALGGATDQAISAVERAIACDPGLARDIAADSDFTNVRSDPRFKRLVGG